MLTYYLLTDNAGKKGMEAKRVIIFAEHGESLLKSYINESLSRQDERHKIKAGNYLC